MNNRNPRARCEICSELIKTPERCKWRYSGVFIVNFEQISYLFLVFLLLTLNVYLPAGFKVHLRNFDRTYEYKNGDNGSNNSMKDQYLQKIYINEKFKQKDKSLQQIEFESIKKT